MFLPTDIVVSRLVKHHQMVGGVLPFGRVATSVSDLPQPMWLEQG